MRFINAITFYGKLHALINVFFNQYWKESFLRKSKLFKKEEIKYN